MIMLAVLALIIIILLAVIVLAVSVGGASVILIFGDVIVCIVFIGILIKIIANRR